MRSPIQVMKREFIKRWTLALETYCKDSSNETTMSVIEKKKLIKQTAAIAMAAAKGGSTAWSRAIIDQQSNNILVKSVTIMGPQDPAKLRLKIKKNNPCSRPTLPHSMICTQKGIRRSKLMMRARRTRSRSIKVAVKASSLAKSIIKKQTQVLKRLLPGGEAMDECCLIEEALDYIVSLKAQVDVMQELANAAEYLNKP